MKRERQGEMELDGWVVEGEKVVVLRVKTKGTLGD